MRILITGAGGLFGRHLVEALQARGDEVRAIVLPSEDASWLKGRGVQTFVGDVRMPESLVEPMTGVDGVFHLAAMMRLWRPMAEYRAVNVEGTENVCRAALRAGVRRLVAVSSAMVYRLHVGRSVTEDDPLNPLHEPYSVTKAEGDRLVLGMAAESGLPAVVVRPGTLVGPGDRLNFGRIADRLRSGSAIVIGRGDNALVYVDVSDAVQGLLLAMDSPVAVGRAYNIGNDQPLTQQEFMSAIAEEIGAPPPRIHVPYAPLYLAATMAERASMLSGYRVQPPLTRHGVTLYGDDNRLSIDRARRELGYEPRVPIREAVRLAAAWYRESNGIPSPRRLTAAAGTVALGGRANGASAAPAQAGASAGGLPLAGKVAVVTGASSGIGEATALEVARRGAKVVLAARRADELERVAERIRLGGGDGIAVRTDLSRQEDVACLVAEARRAYGRVDVLVHSAGQNLTLPFVETSDDDIEGIVQANLLGAVRLTRALLEEMVARRSGSIVFVGSVAGRVVVEPLYSATKFGVRGFALALRRQLLGSGVSVSLVAPGNTRTAMTGTLTERMQGPEVVARAIADLVARPRREVVVPFSYNAVVWLETLLPELADMAFWWRRRGRNVPRTRASAPVVASHEDAARDASSNGASPGRGGR